MPGYNVATSFEVQVCIHGVSTSGPNDSVSSLLSTSSVVVEKDLFDYSGNFAPRQELYLSSSLHLNPMFILEMPLVPRTSKVASM